MGGGGGGEGERIWVWGWLGGGFEVVDLGGGGGVLSLIWLYAERFWGGGGIGFGKTLWDIWACYILDGETPYGTSIRVSLSCFVLFY